MLSQYISPTLLHVERVGTHHAQCAAAPGSELGEPSPLAQRIGNMPAPSTALNATDTIWQFFAANHR